MYMIGNVMSRGLLAYIEIVRDKKSKQAFAPSEKVGAKVFAKAMEKGVIIRGISHLDTDIIGIYLFPLKVTTQ